MPTMSGVEQAFCRSAPWRWWTRSVVLPWSLQDVDLCGEVLEIGAGSGAMAGETLNRHPDARLTLTDIDPRMVRATSDRLGHRERITVVEADATELPFPDASFEYCVSYLMLHHVVAWEWALIEVCRVLRPGGKLIGYDLTNTRLARSIHVVDRSPHRLLAPDDLRSGLIRAGFADVRVRPSFRSHAMRFAARKAPFKPPTKSGSADPAEIEIAGTSR